jgi:hypothetical protein
LPLKQIEKILGYQVQRIFQFFAPFGDFCEKRVLTY